MKPFLLVVLFATASISIHGQGNPPGVSKASERYYESRFTTTEPPFALAKVKRLVKRIKPTKQSPDDDGHEEALSDKTFGALSVKERFTYCMIHGEVFTQNCDVMSAGVGEEKKLFAQIPSEFGSDGDWSDRQHAFLTKHRTEVIGLIRETIKARHEVGLNLKNAIEFLDAYELIPDMVAVYNRAKKDNDILTVFFLLMKDGKYKPFVESQSYRKLYGDENSSYSSFIDGNSANKKLTIERAMAYYKSRKG